MTLQLSASSPDRDTTGALQVGQVLSAEYVAVALLSVAVWDTLVSGRLEYLSFWRARCGLLKCLYLATRYLGLAIGVLLVASFDVHVRQCDVVVKVTMSLITAACFIRISLRSYRIVAIFHFNRALIVLSSFGVVSTTVIQAYLVHRWIGLASYPDDGIGCHIGPDPKYRWVGPVYWLPLVVDSTILLSLITYRTISQWREFRSSAAWPRTFLSIFWNDGARFQAMLFSVNVTALILSLFRNPLFGFYFLPIVSVGSATLLCRLVHSLRPRVPPAGEFMHERGPPSRLPQHSNYLCGEFGSIRSLLEFPPIAPAAAVNDRRPTVLDETARGGSSGSIV